MLREDEEYMTGLLEMALGRSHAELDGKNTDDTVWNGPI